MNNNSNISQNTPFPRSEKLRAYVEKGISGSHLWLGRDEGVPSSRWQPFLKKGVWLKREDELVYGANGSKFRKLLSLASALRGVQKVRAAGSARSAFLLGLSQLCAEKAIPLELFLLKSTGYRDEGPDLFYRQAFQNLTVHWQSREEWQATPPDEAGALIIPEGGSIAHCLPGSLTLALDIAQQMKTLGESPDEIWVDAGSGLTAQALIIGLGECFENPPHVEVVLCAGQEQTFREGLRKAQNISGLSGEAPFTVQKPPTAASYGATNQKVWQAIQDVHSQTGVLLDPIYGAKLYLAMEHKGLKNRSLIIHSGGQNNLLSFGAQYAQTLKSIERVIY